QVDENSVVTRTAIVRDALEILEDCAIGQRDAGVRRKRREIKRDGLRGVGTIDEQDVEARAAIIKAGRASPNVKGIDTFGAKEGVDAAVYAEDVADGTTGDDEVFDAVEIQL